MDAVVDPRFAGALAAARRPRDPEPRGRPDPLRRPGRGPRRDRRARPTTRSRTSSRRRTRRPVREELIARRIEEIHAAGSKAAVAATPGAARRFGPFCAEHGADLFLVQCAGQSAPATSRRATTRSRSPSSPGSCRSPSRSATRRTAEAAFALMEQGAAAVFVGVGPGRRLHDPRGPRHRHPAGHRDQRRRRRPRRLPRARPAATSRSSPTAGCAAAASWPRRSPPARTS